MWYAIDNYKNLFSIWNGCIIDYIYIMTTLQIIDKIKSKQAELINAWIVHLQIFGSFARGDFDNNSDIDLLYEFDAKQDNTWRWVFGVYNILENITQKKIDLISSKFIDNSIKESVLSNVINIY